MLTPIHFDTAVVAKADDGSLSIALMAPLPLPHNGLRAVVTLLSCSEETAASLCADVAQAGSNGNGENGQ